ncbi:LPO_1073/Vpar_1526 family protein [Kribbella sp. NPDC051620]|uniref:LPO_1073/Vpar_1526 family protein n=1 Tax=Kribbella sp. NPDC051620 TaxID=3364120 RepID=UPI0037B4DF28
MTIEDNGSLTAGEVTNIGLNIARNNMIQFSGHSQEIVDVRVQRFIEMFIAGIDQHPNARLDAVKDPDIQYSLLIAEKEYARSGDETTAGLLVDLLVGRCALEQRGLQALVLNEAIETVGRLTRRQVSTLTASWLVTRTVLEDIDSVAKYAEWLAADMKPFFDISEHISEYQHLAFLGCVSMDGSGRGFGYVAGRVYPGAFAKGLEREAIPPALRPYDSPFKPCTNFPDLLQVAAKDSTQVKNIAATCGLDDLSAETLQNVFEANVMSEGEAQDILISNLPAAEEFIRRWNTTQMLRINVTSVGLAIAYANWARISGSENRLSVWIPDDV